jgi:hypothetical protein
MARRITEIAGKIESHWTLFNLIRDNWGWIVTTLGLAGMQGWFVWFWQAAIGAPWYQKGLVLTTGVLLTVFVITGVRAFLAWHRRTAREEGAVAAGLSWSGHTYANGSIIEGGTHRLVEVFGTDQLRSNLTFRNCQILGPGAAAYFNCHVEKTEFFGLPGVQFIDPRYAGNISAVTHQFIKCRFENCVFSGIVHIMRLDFSGPDMHVYRMVPSSFDEPEWPTNPPAASPPSPVPPASPLGT